VTAFFVLSCRTLGVFDQFWGSHSGAVVVFSVAISPGMLVFRCVMGRNALRGSIQRPARFERGRVLAVVGHAQQL
jgi:hypothetical protein